MRASSPSKRSSLKGSSPRKTNEDKRSSLRSGVNNNGTSKLQRSLSLRSLFATRSLSTRSLQVDECSVQQNMSHHSRSGGKIAPSSSSSGDSSDSSGRKSQRRSRADRRVDESGKDSRKKQREKSRSFGSVSSTAAFKKFALMRSGSFKMNNTNN